MDGLVLQVESCKWLMKRNDPHSAVRHSFIAVFSSRHLNTIKKPDSLQQWVKAEKEKHTRKLLLIRSQTKVGITLQQNTMNRFINSMKLFLN